MSSIKSSLSDNGRNVVKGGNEGSDGARYNIDFDRFAREKFGKEQHVKELYREHVNTALRIKPEKQEPVVDIQAQQKERVRQQQMRQTQNVNSAANSTPTPTATTNNTTNVPTPSTRYPTASPKISPTVVPVLGGNSSSNSSGTNLHGASIPSSSSFRPYNLPPPMSIPQEDSQPRAHSMNFHHVNINVHSQQPNPSPRVVQPTNFNGGNNIHVGSSLWKEPININGESKFSKLSPLHQPSHPTPQPPPAPAPAPAPAATHIHKYGSQLPSNIVIPNSSEDRSALLASFKQDVDRMRSARTSSINQNSRTREPTVPITPTVSGSIGKNSSHNTHTTQSSARIREVSSPPPKYRPHEGHAYVYKPSTTQPQDDIDQMLSKMDTREVKTMLDKLHVDTTGCIEKSDYYEQLKNALKMQKKKQSSNDSHHGSSNSSAATSNRNSNIHRTRTDYTKTSSSTSNSSSSSNHNSNTSKPNANAANATNATNTANATTNEQMTQKITNEVDAWARKKPLYVLLNEVNGDNVLRAQDPLPTLTKGYRKAMQRIHPDKHMGDPAAYIRATEMFKHITSAYEALKKLSS